MDAALNIKIGFGTPRRRVVAQYRTRRLGTPPPASGMSSISGGLRTSSSSGSLASVKRRKPSEYLGAPLEETRNDLGQKEKYIKKVLANERKMKEELAAAKKKLASLQTADQRAADAKAAKAASTALLEPGEPLP